MPLVAGVVAWILALAAPRPLRRVFARLHHDERGGLPKPPNPFDPDTWKGLFSRVGGGVELIGDVLNVVLDIIPTFVGTIATMAETIGTLTANAGSTVFDAIAGSVSLLWSVIANFAAGLFERVEAAAALIWSVVANLASGLFERLENVGSLIWGVIANLASGLFERIEGAASLVWGVIANFASGIFERIEGFASTVFSVIAVVGGGIADRLLDVATTIRDAITFVGSLYVDWLRFLVDAVVGLGEKVENIGATVVEKGLDTAKSREDEILDVLLGLAIEGGPAGYIIEKITGQSLGDRLKLAGRGVHEGVEWALSQGLDTILSVANTDPEDAPSVLTEMLTTQLLVGVGLAAGEVALSSIPTISGEGLVDLTQYARTFAGAGVTIDDVYRAAVKSGVSTPLGYYINSRAAAEIPSQGALDRLFRQRRIAEGAYDANLAYHGLRDDWRQAAAESAFNTLGVGDISRLMRWTDLPDDRIDAMLREAGYADDVIPSLLLALRQVSLARPNTKLITEANEAYQKGFIDDAQYSSYLSDAGIRPTEQLQWLKAAKLNYLNQVRSDLLSAWRSAAKSGGISEDEFRAQLAIIGLTGQKIEVEVLRVHAAQARSDLAATGLTERQAVNKARAALTSAYKLQYRKGLIDDAGLHDRLVVIGYPDFAASAVVELAQAEKFQPTDVAGGNSPEDVSRRSRAALQQAYIVQFQRDLIDAGQLRSSLVAIGVNDFEAASVVAREQARKTPSPAQIGKRTAARVAAEVMATLKLAYAEQFQNGLITADALEDQLVAIGMSPEAARARRLLEEARSFHPDEEGSSADDRRHATQLQSAAKAAAIERFRAGVIEISDMRAELIGAGIFADIVEQLAAQELARQAGDLRDDAESIEQRDARELRTAEKASAIQQYRSEFVDEEGLVALLIEAGLAEDVAIAIATAELARASRAAPA